MTESHEHLKSCQGSKNKSFNHPSRTAFLSFFFCKWGGKYKHPEEEYNFFPTLAYCQLLKHEMWSLPILARMTTNVVAHKNYPVPFQNPVTVFNVRIFYSTSGCTEVNAPITRSCCTSFAVHEHKIKKKKICFLQFILVKSVFKQNQIWKEKQMWTQLCSVAIQHLIPAFQFSRPQTVQCTADQFKNKVTDIN